MNLKELLNYSKKYLEDNKIEDPLLISKLLVQYVFKISKEKIIIFYDKDINDDEFFRYKNFLEKISKGFPIQYIINQQEFMKLNFFVDENVLIPQPDTETLVEEVIKTYKNCDCKILDMCTGSGAIAVALAKYIENSYITASDISNKAIQVAKLNAEKNEVNEKISFIESDMFKRIEFKEYDAIVSNPPYIESNKISSLDSQVKSEPLIALDGGLDGLDFYRIIISNAYEYIKKNGKLFLEIGYDQKEEVFKLLGESTHYKDLYCVRDLSGNDRVIIATVWR